MAWNILEGDVIEVLKTLHPQQFNTVVTSPPYWGLRDYGVVGQIGLERTPAEYLDRMVGVFREVWRFLRDDGTLWLNMGDSYVSQPNQRGTDDCVGWKQATNTGSRSTPSRHLPDLPAKNLVGMPWRLAFALQADGWYLRSDIIWHKPNPMPESVTDRPTKSHEYIFLLTKSERYYYDAEAIKEDVTGGAHARGDGVNPKAAAHNNSRTQRSLPSHKSNPTEKVNGIRPRYKMPDGWATGPGGHGSFNRKGREKGRSPKDNGREEQGLKVSARFGRGPGWRNKQNESFSGSVNELVDSRNKRSVWTVATQAFPDAHFATFPEELIQPCILAGCPVGGTVLDPFSGSGTTGVVALRYHRDFLGIELNPEYAEMARRRITQDAPLFNTQVST